MSEDDRGGQSVEPAGDSESRETGVATRLPALPDDWDRALVIVAHPDDVEWALGPAVAAWTTAGREVRYLLVTRGEAGIAGMAPAEAGPVREREQLEAARAVGVSSVDFLDHDDGRIEEGLRLRRDLAREIRRHRPDLVITMNHAERWGDAPGAGWNTADHRAVGRCGLDAVGDAGNEWIFPELMDEGFEPWDVRRIAIAASLTPTHTVDASDHLDAAVAALAAHAEYLRALRPDVQPAAFAAEVVRGGGDPSAADDGPRLVPFEVVG